MSDAVAGALARYYRSETGAGGKPPARSADWFNPAQNPSGKPIFSTKR